MPDKLFVFAPIDPRDLAVNLRFRGKQVIHPKVRAAQAQLADAVYQAVIEQGWTPCAECSLTMSFIFPSKRSDIDGPIKRSIDAIERGIKATGLTWNDLRVVDLRVHKGKVGDRAGTWARPVILIWLGQKEE